MTRIEELRKEIEAKTGLKATITDVKKNNGLLKKGICILEQEASISPVIYMEESFDFGDNISVAADKVIKAWKDATSYAPEEMVDIVRKLDKQYILEHTEYELCNKEMNVQLSATAPHRDILDLTIFYRCSIGNDTSATFLITDSLAQAYGIEPNELEAAASINATRQNAKAVSMVQIMRENGADFLDAEDVSAPKLFVITNEAKLRGAWTLVCPDIIGRLADELESDLYLLPSSIHEIIAISADEIDDSEALRGMVASVNETKVMPYDVLSNSVYKWSRDKCELTIVE